MDSDTFKAEFQDCDWLFDLFATGYDFIATRVTPGPDLDVRYPNLASVIGQLATSRMGERLIVADGAVPPQVLDFLSPAVSWSRL